MIASIGAPVAWSLTATAVLGLIVEMEEGATRTGNCRLTDVLPDVLGGCVAAIVVAIGRRGVDGIASCLALDRSLRESSGE